MSETPSAAYADGWLFLGPSPTGVNAHFAHSLAGGDGAGQHLVALDWGWDLHHRAFAHLNPTLLSGINHGPFLHGTASLGIAVGRDPSEGFVGLAPAVASAHVVSPWRAGGEYSTATALHDALDEMAFGDVLLVNAQTDLPDHARVFIEVLPGVLNALRRAREMGVVVIEAAGNGGTCLDLLSPIASEDSGAIVVGACHHISRARLPTSCFGKRVDCFAWGDAVCAPGASPEVPAHTHYGWMAGTSAAAPIIAGVALVVQGLSERIHGRQLSPPRCAGHCETHGLGRLR